MRFYYALFTLMGNRSAMDAVDRYAGGYVRSAAVLCAVGTYGIGMALRDIVYGFLDAKTGVVKLIIVATVSIIDLVSASIRRVLA